MVTRTTMLRGSPLAPEPHRIGSLRNLAKSIDLVPGHRVAGGRIRDLFDLYFSQRPELIERCCRSLGTDVAVDELFPAADLASLRGDILALIRKNCPSTPDSSGLTPSPFGTGIQGDLLFAWANWASDPAASAAHWMRDGAPAGISQDFQLDGILEPIADEEPLGVDELISDHRNFANYLGVETDPEALAILENYIHRGWLSAFDSAEALAEHVGGQPIFNKFACIVKQRMDGSTKRRIIMDSKRSSVTAASKKMYKAILPRATDLVTDVLSLKSEASPSDGIDLLVLDAEDAFWQVPLHKDEMRYYCSLLRYPSGRVRYLSYNRTAQGSRGAPLAWSVMFGLICRCALGTLYTPGRPTSQYMQVYVDDPILAIRGPPAARRRHAATVMLAWAVLSISLAVRKGQFSETANWIGHTFAVTSDGITATILADRLDEVRLLTSKLVATNVVSLTELRSYVGKIQSMASLLFTWRPFVHMCYAVIHGPGGEAPVNCRWTKQLQTPLLWIQAFLSEQVGDLVRHFSVDSFLRRGQRITITTDASPYGIGGVLELDGVISSFFGDRVTVLDRDVLGLGAEPSSRDQQALEALAVLVSLREWSGFWLNRRVRLSVRTDNIAALTMVCKMQPHSESLGLIARELALDIAKSSFAPDEAVHIPGIANKAADHLSRLFDPSFPQPPTLPPYLPEHLKHECSTREEGWWKTRAPR